MSDKVKITKTKLDNLANAVAAKSGKSVLLTVDQMTDAVLDIITPSGTLDITENGTHDVTKYANAKVDIQDTFVITPIYSYNNGPIWTINKTYDEVDAAYKAGKTIVVDAKISYGTNFYQYCSAVFYPLKDSSTQDYEIVIGWQEESDNLYYEYIYNANLNDKSWFLNYENRYEHPKYLIEKTIMANGIYDPSKNFNEYASGYSKVTVNVPPTTLQPLTATPSTKQQVFNASSQISDTMLFSYKYSAYGGGLFPVELTIGTDYWLVLTRYNGTAGWADSQINKVFDPVLWTATENYSYPFEDSSMRIRYSNADNMSGSWRYQIDIYPVASSMAYAPVTVEPIPDEYIIPTGESEITSNGTYDVTNIASVMVNVSTENIVQDENGYLILDENGSSSSLTKNMDDPIRFFDYDGTLVASYDSIPSSLPINPSHKGLIAQGWNWSLEDIATQFTSFGTCDVGQMYTTRDGRTKIYITVSDITKTFWLGLCPNGTLLINWGDGSENSSMTGTSSTTIKTVQHTYVTAGSYVISIEVESGEFAFYNTTNNYTRLLGKYQSTSNYYNQVYGGCVTAIELGDGATIGSCAFAKLSNMTSITIPNTVTYINDHAFDSCFSLKSITIPNTVTYISNSTFYSCYSLKSIIIPNTITYINGYAFQYCYALESIIIPNTVTNIGGSAFSRCYSLKSIIIPNNVNSIGNYTFQYCYTLESIIIPDTITSIGSYIFNDCYSLKSITVPNTITVISRNAFQNCYALESITIPDNITSINNSTFQCCYSLKSIIIPNNVTKINDYAFYECYNMDEYHFLSTTPPILVSTSVFNSIQSNCKIYVPYSADHSILTAYQTAENWSTYASYMVEESE